MLINISSNIIYIYSNWKTSEIPRGSLEIELPKVLFDIINNEWWIINNEIYVINWPGSFTNLRIGCLCLNMLNDLIKCKIENAKWKIIDSQLNINLYTIDKISLYTHLYEQKILWSRGLIYIGQQKNAWSIDLDTEQVEKVGLSELDTYDWVDQFDGMNADNFVKFWFENSPDKPMESQIIVKFKWNRIALDPIQIWFKEVEQLVPNYMIEPNISVKRLP